MSSTIFSDIIKKKIYSKILYQDNLITAFYDKNPQTPIHIIILPNKIIKTVNHVTKQDEKVLGRLFIVAAKIAKKKKINKEGYRLIINCNKYGGQEIYHLHMHLLGGKKFTSLV